MYHELGEYHELWEAGHRALNAAGGFLVGLCHPVATQLLQTVKGDPIVPTNLTRRCHRIEIRNGNDCVMRIDNEKKYTWWRLETAGRRRGGLPLLDTAVLITVGAA
jgi:hypothetical protein